jgi:hypothetical protein
MRTEVRGSGAYVEEENERLYTSYGSGIAIYNFVVTRLAGVSPGKIWAERVYLLPTLKWDCLLI